MARRWRQFDSVMTALGALLLLYVLWRVGDTGGFDPVPSVAGSCAPVETNVAITGAAQDDALGFAYLSGIDGVSGRGGIYVLDMREQAPLLIRMNAGDLGDMHPGPLGFYRGPDGAGLLFVIDRHPGGERVKIFDVTGTRAALRETISDPAFRTLADLVPVGPREFYLLNATRPAREAAMLLVSFGISDGEILRFDGLSATEVASGLVTASGIAASADGAVLYVSERLPHRLRIYRRDAASGALGDARRIALGAMPDKLAPDRGGRLWLTGQPRLFRLFLHRLNGRIAAPSQALSVDPVSGAAQLVYSGDGALIPNAGIALSGDGSLLMAARGEARLAVCK